VYIAPSQFEAAFISIAHDEPIIMQTLAKIQRGFRQLD